MLNDSPVVIVLPRITVVDMFEDASVRCNLFDAEN